MQNSDEEMFQEVQEPQAMQLDEEDKLSALPNEIIYHILTFSGFKDIFRATALSRSWRNLDIPTVLPRLNFRHRPRTRTLDSVRVRQFFESIKDALRERRLNIIAGFGIDFPFHSCYQHDVALLILEAVEWKVKNLNIILTNGLVDGIEIALHDSEMPSNFHFFILPASLYENPFLEMLSFSMCRFDHLEEIKWGFLKELKIGYSCLKSGNSSVIKAIVSGCPALEVLELNKCCGFKFLNFNKHFKLKKLVVNDIWEKVEETGNFISISAPTVRVLELLGDFCMKKVIIWQMKSCVEAKLDYHMSFGEHHCSIGNLISNLNNLNKVRTLICGTWLIEIVSWNSEYDFQLELRECKYLTLHSPLLLPYELGILRLLQSCPNTKELIISAARSSPLDEDHQIINRDDTCQCHGVKHKTTRCSKLWKIGFKTLKLTNFGGRHFANEISFLNFILKNARSMEYMDIDHGNNP